MVNLLLIVYFVEETVYLNSHYTKLQAGTNELKRPVLALCDNWTLKLNARHWHGTVVPVGRYNVISTAKVLH